MAVSVALVTALSVSPLLGASAQASPVGKVESLVRKYEASSGAICGVQVVDLRTDRRLVSIREDRQFIPASNQKLLTSAFALAKLGPDHQFVTSVYRLGESLLVVGGGDPTLGDPIIAARKGADIYCELDRWAEAVKNTFGGDVPSDLLVCGGFSLTKRRHEDWPAKQRSRWYCAPIAGLNFHNNCFEAAFVVDDKSVRASVSPSSRHIKVSNKVARGKRHLWSLRTSENDSRVVLTGTVSKSTTTALRVACENPPMLLGWVLADRLARAGVRLSGQVRLVKRGEPDTSGATLLARTVTPLADVLRRANKLSLNMAAECLFLHAGDGTWRGSAEKMKAAMVSEYAIDGQDLTVRDGGGLSRLNRVTPRAVCGVLSGLALRRGAQAFLKSLPRSGTDGSLAKRLTRKPYSGRILAKTGYINSASCLSGYVLDGDYRVALAFSILVGNVKLGKAWVAKDCQDSICRVLVGWMDGEGK